MLSKAHKYELARHNVILCTCSAASAPSLEKLDIRQIIIDECAMATEPDTLIPLVSHRRAEKVSPFQRRLSRRLLWALKPLHVLHPSPRALPSFTRF